MQKFLRKKPVRINSKIVGLTFLEYSFSKIAVHCGSFLMKFLDIFRDLFFANWKRSSGGVLDKKIKFVEPIHGPALFS